MKTFGVRSKTFSRKNRKPSTICRKAFNSPNAVRLPKPPPTRLSYTFPVIQSAREVWLVASGAEKAEAFAEALRPGADPNRYPAAGAIGRERTLALIDADAAAALPPELLRRS